jgi:hypothetical protein
MDLDFKNICLYGMDGEIIEVDETIYCSTPEDMYCQCVDIAEDYGVVLRYLTSEMLGEGCVISLCDDSGELILNI